jgi:hypothetical protein
VVRGRKGEYSELFATLQARGFARARVDGQLVHLDSPPELEKKLKHSIDVVVDRLVVKDTMRVRLTDSVETALDLAGGPTVAVRAVLTDMSRFTTDGIAYDGILGNDVLRQFEVRFDVPAGALTMALPGSGASLREDLDCIPNLRDSSAVPGLAGFGFFDLSLRLSRSEDPGVKVRAVLDTGAAATVINPMAAAALGVTEGDSRLRPFEDGTKGFSGAAVNTHLLDLDGTSAAGWRWKPSTVRVSPLPVFQVLGLDQQPAAVVGIDFLRHVAIGFDAGLPTLCFSRAP